MTTTRTKLSSPNDPLVARAAALALAARAGCDPRTAARALRDGPMAIRTLVVRSAIERALRELQREGSDHAPR